MTENIGTNISKNVSGKYSQKLLDHAYLQQIQLKFLQKEQFKTQQKPMMI